MTVPTRMAHAGVVACLIWIGAIAAAAIEIEGSATIDEDVTDGILVTDGSAGDVLTIEDGVSVETDGFGDTIRIDPSDYEVVNDGDIISGVLGSGVSFSGNDGELTNGGSIDGSVSAVFFDLGGASVTNNGSLSSSFGVTADLTEGGSVVNETDATIESTASIAVQIGGTVDSSEAELVNRGEIAGGNATRAAVELSSTVRAALDNEGDITGTDDAVRIMGVADASNGGTITATAGRGVVLAGSGTFENDGTIASELEGVQVDADADVTNRGAITSNADVGVRLDGAGDLVNQGSISGPLGAVVASGAASVTSSGSLDGGSAPAVSFSGDFANTLTLSGSAATTGAIAVAMGGGDDLVVLNSGASLGAGVDGGAGSDTLRLLGSGSFGEALSGVETLQMNGSAWTLTGALAGISDSFVNSGSLTVNGSLSGAISVGPGARLLGTGSVGDVNNAGTVAPGQSIGTLQAASYVQQPGGTLAVEISNTTRDLLDVAGSADLAGTLSLTPVGSVIDVGPVEVLRAGTLNGTFDQLAVSPLYTPSVDYVLGANGSVSVSLLLTGSFASLADSENQEAVGETVDLLLPTATGDLADVLGALLAIPDVSGVQRGLDQLSPEPLGATAQVAFTNAQWHAAVLTEHLRDLRLGTGGTAPSLSVAPGALPTALLTTSAALPGTREVGVPWLRANTYGVYSDLSDSSGHTGFGAVGGVFGLGVEAWLTQGLVAGVDLSAGYTWIDSDRSGSDVNDVSGRLTGFGSFESGPWYVDALGSYAYHWYDASRRIQYGSIDRDANSDHGANELSGYLGSGFDFSAGGFVFGPELSGQYTALLEDGYDESSAGAAGLDVDDRNEDSLATRAGLRLSRSWQIDRSTTIVPRLRVAWMHEWLDTSQDLSASFPGPTPNGFEVSSASPSRDSVQALIGFRAQLGDQILFEANYGIDAGRSDYISQQAGVVLRARF